MPSVAGDRPLMRPEPTARGFASADPAEIAELVASAWDGVAELALRLDLDAPSRLPGWTVRDVLVHLGSWPEHARFSRLVEDVRLGRLPERDDVDARNALVVAAHADAGPGDVAAALARARDAALAFLASPDAEHLGREPAESPVGRIPLTCVVAASAYELAVHALDVCPADDAPAPVLHAGVGTLVDTAGALAARAGLTTRFAVFTPLGGWGCRSEGEGWTTLALGSSINADELGWPSLQGTAADVLDAAAGRRPVLHLVLTRRLRLGDVPGLLTLLPALESVPGLPGGPALRAAGRALARTGWLVGRIGATIRGS
jgi:uncharacterized protein (TIGR03083 family)